MVYLKFKGKELTWPALYRNRRRMFLQVYSNILFQKNTTFIFRKISSVDMSFKFFIYFVITEQSVAWFQKRESPLHNFL